ASCRRSGYGPPGGGRLADSLGGRRHLRRRQHRGHCGHSPRGAEPAVAGVVATPGPPRPARRHRRQGRGLAHPGGGGVSGKALWYLTRGSGAVSLVLLTLALVLGILTSARWVRERWPRFVVEGLHRNLALLAPVFVGIHIASAVVDGYVPIR